MKTSLASLMLVAALAAPLSLVPSPADAQATPPAVSVDSPWVRAVPGQSASGAFMTVHATQAVRLVGASTPVAGVAEIHQMSMDGGVMRMTAVPSGLAIAAGQSVELKPGGYHVMLMDLKKPIAAGDSVPITLRFEDAAGKLFEIPVAAKASLAPPAAAH